MNCYQCIKQNQLQKNTLKKLLHNNNLLIVDDHHKYLPHSYIDPTLHAYRDSSSLFIDRLDEETINFLLNDDSIFQSLKKKLNETFDKGTKWLAKNGDKIADKLQSIGDIAEKVEMVSGVVQGVATVASAIPGVGFIAAPIAAGAGAVRLSARTVGVTMRVAEHSTRLATEFSKGYQEGGVKAGLKKTGKQAIKSGIAFASYKIADKAASAFVGASGKLAGKISKNKSFFKKITPRKLTSSIGKLKNKIMAKGLKGTVKGAGKSTVNAVKGAGKASVKAVKGAGKSVKSGVMKIKSIKGPVTSKPSFIKRAPTAIKNDFKSGVAEYKKGFNIKKNIKDSWKEMTEDKAKVVSSIGKHTGKVTESYGGESVENKLVDTANSASDKLFKKLSSSSKVRSAILAGPSVAARIALRNKMEKLYDDYDNNKSSKNNGTTTSNQKQSTSSNKVSTKPSQTNSSPTTSTVSKGTNNKNNASGNVANTKK
ncbi:hypothetical protein QTN25_008837 [Entamoeba marina]